MGDTRPANILVVTDEQSAEKYHLLLSDLGGACDKTSLHLKKYPRVYTGLYFSKLLLRKMSDRSYIFSDREII